MFGTLASANLPSFDLRAIAGRCSAGWRLGLARARALFADRWPALAALALTALLGVALSWGAWLAWAEAVPEGQPPAGEILSGGYDALGTLGGAWSVGAAGAASWTTALKVVPGVGGMQPALSIGYGGNGYGGLGVGFSLSAGGAVSRCRPTLGQDGEHGPVRWTQDSPLCLDGARLVAVSGAYGAANTEYRVQTAPLVRVVGLGASTDAHSGFVVYTPDGRQTLYGVLQPLDWTGESVQWARIDGTLVPFSWHIARVIDRKTQNQMRYRYRGEAVAGDGVMTPEDHRLDRIEYGINPTGGTDVTRQVVFAYTPVQDVLGQPQAWEDKAWVHQGFVAGMVYTRWRVLSGVTMQVHEQGDWQTVRQYRLGYEPVPDAVADASSADRVRLATLAECAATTTSQPDGDGTWGGDTTQCFRPTHFSWSQAPEAMTALPNFGFDGAPFYPLPPASELQAAQYDRVAMQVVGDFDGDGREDFLVMPERMNTAYVPYMSWELWRTDADIHGAVATNLGAWSTQPWTSRAGTVVPVAEDAMQTPSGMWPQNATLADKVRPADPVRTGQRRAEQATPGAWAINYDGSGGTDVLLGEPVLELAGALMDPPWGLGSKTTSARHFAANAPEWCANAFVDLSVDGYLACMNEHLGQSAADYTGHPGFMRDLKIVQLRSDDGSPTASFSETSLHYPDGQPILWAQPFDMNGDALSDLMFCKADADYAQVAGQALPMYYGQDPAYPPVNWVSGHLYYALNVPGTGLSLADGGTLAGDGGQASSQPIPCHAKDSYLVLDLDGDGAQSLLHRTHLHAGQISIGGISPGVPAGVVDDPYPLDPQKPELSAYLPKLTKYVWAQKTLGAAVYSAFTYRDGAVHMARPACRSRRSCAGSAAAATRWPATAPTSAPARATKMAAWPHNRGPRARAG